MESAKALGVPRFVGDSLAAFARNRTTGALTFLEAHRDGVNGVDGLDGPIQVAVGARRGAPLSDVFSVVVSPDARYLYAVGANSDNLVAFRISPRGINRELLPVRTAVVAPKERVVADRVDPGGRSSSLLTFAVVDMLRGPRNSWAVADKETTMGVAIERKPELPWHLKGNWAPVQDELTVDGLAVEGEIPRQLNGLYIRNGMNPRSGWSDHWFFGTGMVHGVALADGKASYRNRYVKTPYYDTELDILSAISDPIASPANTHVFRHAGRILALEEAHVPWQIDRQLETVGPVTFDGKLQRAFTAHPRICPETGEMLAFGYTPMQAPHLTYYRIDARGNLVQTEPIEIPRPVMMHDWNVTRNHVIFMDLPIVFALEHGGFAFKPECGARLGVMPRHGSNADVKWLEIEPCYVFHPLNAHEEGDKIVLHVCRQPHAMKEGLHNIGAREEDTTARLWRWTIDQVAGTVKEEQIDDAPGDFPRIDDRRIGLNARYGYTLGLLPETGSPYYDRWIYKYDLHSGTRQRHDLGEHVHGGEPQFAPRSPDAAEDDGWILSIVHDEDKDQSSLVILDARDIEAAAVAKVALPRRVPYGAHGNWFPES